MSSDRPIVYVTPVLPWPANQGSRQFQLEAARALATVGPVTWITRTIGDQAEAEQQLRAEGFDLRLDRSFTSRAPWLRLRRRVRIDAAAAWRREPREVHFVSSAGVRARVADAARAVPEAWFVGAFWSTVRALREAPVGRRVLLASDVESDRATQARAFDDAGRAHAREARRLENVELEAFTTVEDLLCLTGEDERAARALLERRAPNAGTRVDRWPVGLRIEEPVSWPPPEDPIELLVYGHWAADFNRDGLGWFLRDVWPALRRARPEISLRVVGRGAEDLRRTIEGVTWVGYVHDLRSELTRCRAVVIPLRYAGGFRYRLVESLGLGRPVVCSPVAALGAEARVDVTHLEADGADAWIEAVGRCLDPVHAEALRTEGRRWALESYGTATSHRRVQETFARLEAYR